MTFTSIHYPLFTIASINPLQILANKQTRKQEVNKSQPTHKKEISTFNGASHNSSCPTEFAPHRNVGTQYICVCASFFSKTLTELSGHSSSQINMSMRSCFWRCVCCTSFFCLTWTVATFCNVVSVFGMANTWYFESIFWTLWTFKSIFISVTVAVQLDAFEFSRTILHNYVKRK